MASESNKYSGIFKVDEIGNCVQNYKTCSEYRVNSSL